MLLWYLQRRYHRDLVIDWAESQVHVLFFSTSLTARDVWETQRPSAPPCDFSVILFKLYCQEASSRPGKPRALHGLGWRISGGSRHQTLGFWPTPLPFNHHHTPNIDPRIVWFVLYQIVDPRKWNVNSFYLKFVNIKSTCFLKMKEQTELQCRCTSCTPLRT